MVNYKFSGKQEIIEILKIYSPPCVLKLSEEEIYLKVRTKFNNVLKSNISKLNKLIE